MREIKLILIFLFVSNSSFGKDAFKINSSAGKVKITINGIKYEIDSNYTSIKTRFPIMDTITFLEQTIGENSGRKLICNFKPDSSYTITPACCATLDIIQSYKVNIDSLNYWGEKEQYDKIQEKLMDQSYFILKIKNGTKKDSIYAWYTDYACFPSYKLIDEIGWEYGIPVKCFYWSNISTFTFFKTQQDDSEFKNEFGVIEDQFPSEKSETLATITVRLFDKDRYIITYDVLKKKISLEYQDKPRK